MQTICDIYLFDEVSGASPLLRRLRIFNPAITFDENRSYSGFLGLDVGRIKAVAIRTQFRQNGIRSVNVPTAYRLAQRLSEAEARACAERFMHGKGHVIRGMARPDIAANPMYWSFLTATDSVQESDPPREGGGIMTIDALDGHEWDGDEWETYSYDYNNEL